MIQKMFFVLCLGFLPLVLSAQNEADFFKARGFYFCDAVVNFTNFNMWEPSDKAYLQKLMMSLESQGLSFNASDPKYLVIEKGKKIRNAIQTISQGDLTLYQLSDEFIQENEFEFSNHFLKAFVDAFCTERFALKNYIKKIFGYEFSVPSDEFQDFSIQELQIIHHALIDLPSHLHFLPQLAGFVRLKSGTINLKKPKDLTSADEEKGWIEITDATFERPLYSVEGEIVRLIGLFYYGYVLSPQLTSKWMSFGQWRFDPASDLWTHRPGLYSTSYDVTDDEEESKCKIGLCKDTHIATPEDDFSYAFSFYMTNPSYLMKDSSGKYQFLNELFQVEYEITTEDRFKFQIYSPTPDVTPPHVVLSSFSIEPIGSEDLTTQLKIKVDISDEQTDLQTAYIKIKNLDQPVEHTISLPVQGKKTFSEAVVSFGSNMPGGLWTVEHMHVQDKARNPINENPKCTFQTFNKKRVLNFEPAAFSLEGIEIIVQPKTETGDIFVEARISGPTNGKKITQFMSASCVSSTKSTRYPYRYDCLPDKNYISITFLFSIFDQKGPWRFSSFSVRDSDGVPAYFNLPDAPQYSFLIPAEAVDLQPISIDVDRMTKDNIEVIDPHKDGTGIQIKVWFEGDQDESGLSKTQGSLVSIRSPSGKRFYGSVRIESENPETHKIRYEGTIVLPDHPEGNQGNQSYMLEEIQMYDRAGNATRENVLQRNIKVTLPQP